MLSMKMSPSGCQILAQREGVKTRAYRDTRGIWTIGVGHTSAAGAPHVYPWSTMTLPVVYATLARDLATFEAAVNRALKRPISQSAFDACVSLAYNIGGGGFAGSSVAKQINAGNMSVAADDFLLWDHPPELLTRRRAERAQFLKPNNP